MQQQSTAAASAPIQPTQWATPYGREMFSMERFMGAIGQIEQQTKQRQDAEKKAFVTNPETAIPIPRPELAPGEIFLTEKLIEKTQLAPQQFKKFMVDDRGNHYLIFPVMQDPNALQNLRVIGDIHSSPEVLDEIRRELENNRNLKYIFLGDYVDRGGEDPLTMQKLAELKAQYPDSVFYICGNHDKAIADPVTTPTHMTIARIGDFAALLTGNQTDTANLVIKAAYSSELKTNLTLPIPHATEFTATTLQEFKQKSAEFINQMPIGVIIPAKINDEIHSFIFTHGSATFTREVVEADGLQIYYNFDWLNTAAIIEGYMNEIRSAECIRSIAANFEKNHIIHCTGHLHRNSAFENEPTLPIVNSGGYSGEGLPSEKQDFAQQLVIYPNGTLAYQPLASAKQLQKRRELCLIGKRREEMRPRFSDKTNDSKYPSSIMLEDIAKIEDIYREHFFAALIVQHPIMQAKDSSRDAKIDVCRNILRHYGQGNKSPDILCYFISQVEKQCLGDPEKLHAFRTACNQFPLILKAAQLIHSDTQQLNISSTLTIAEVCTIRITEEILLAMQPDAKVAQHAENVQQYIQLLNAKQIALPLLQEQIQATISNAELPPEKKYGAIKFAEGQLSTYKYAKTQSFSACNGLFSATRWYTTAEISKKIEIFLQAVFTNTGDISLQQKLQYLQEVKATIPTCYGSALIELFIQTHNVVATTIQVECQTATALYAQARQIAGLLPHSDLNLEWRDASTNRLLTEQQAEQIRAEKVQAFITLPELQPHC